MAIDSPAKASFRTTATALDLTTVGLPTYVEYNMGDTPTNSDGSPLDPKYSEGNLVE